MYFLHRSMVRPPLSKLEKIRERETDPKSLPVRFSFRLFTRRSQEDYENEPLIRGALSRSRRRFHCTEAARLIFISFSTPRHARHDSLLMQQQSVAFPSLVSLLLFHSPHTHFLPSSNLLCVCESMRLPTPLDCVACCRPVFGAGKVNMALT